MRILALSGSARRLSTNTALLRALARVAPEGVTLSVYDDIAALPVFSPDGDASPPPRVQEYIGRVGQADGLIVASPEYVRAIPGGLKNAIDWLVSRETLVDKPIALAHASHRGDDMLAALRLVLATVSTRFAPQIFLRFALMKKTPQDVDAFFENPETVRAAQDFLAGFAAFSSNR